ncbi:MAG: heavy-metal-associated domain-containing protein [Gemmatimonadota bacterium]
MKNLTLEIEGMKCEGCASRVRAALHPVPGVRRVDVSLEEARARVIGDNELDLDALMASVENAGYRARIVS